MVNLPWDVIGSSFPSLSAKSHGLWELCWLLDVNAFLTNGHPCSFVNQPSTLSPFHQLLSLFHQMFHPFSLTCTCNLNQSSVKASSNNTSISTFATPYLFSLTIWGWPDNAVIPVLPQSIPPLWRYISCTLQPQASRSPIPLIS